MNTVTGNLHEAAQATQMKVADFYSSLWIVTLNSFGAKINGIHAGLPGNWQMSIMYQACIEDENQLLNKLWDAAFTAYLDDEKEQFVAFASTAHGIKGIFMENCMNYEAHVIAI